MKTTSRLTLVCIALALFLTSAIIYAAPVSTLSRSMNAQNANKKTRRKSTRRRRLVTSAPVPPKPVSAVPHAEAPPSRPSPNVSAAAEAPPASSSMPRPVAPISGGVLNGKAISKPQPAYPPIAKAARASGTVTVQILIDESGRVVSAHAVSGHPLLQEAAVQAAYQARFTPTLLSGQPVKVSGVITYNFVLQ
jgi:TonB family protein